MKPEEGIILNAVKIKGFVNLFLKQNFDVPVETPDCHMEWWEMCTTKHPFVAIAAPRNHAKSTAITHSYTLANVCFRIKNFILIISDTEQQAMYFLADIKRELTHNEDLIKVFGIKGLEKDTESDIIVNFDDNYQCRIIAKGSEQKLRGIKWNNKRPKLIVIDDPENDEIVLNPDRRKKFRDWFSGALLPCRAVDGEVRYVGTILHMDSMLQRLMPREYSSMTVKTPLSLKSAGGTAWKSALYRAHDRDFSHILWPERWNKEKLLAEREHYVSQGQADKYSQEYLNYPIDEENSFFSKNDLLAMDAKDRKAPKIYYVGVDLAVTQAQSADYSTFVIGGVDEDSILHIVEVIRARLDSAQLVEFMMEINKRYDPYLFFFEKGAITNSILPHLHVAMTENNNFFSYELFPRVVDKVSFAQTIRARTRIRKVRFDTQQDWYPVFEEELLKFPRDIHDDQVDAFAILGRGIEKFNEASTQQEQVDEDYERERRESEFDMEQGRSLITGY